MEILTTVVRMSLTEWRIAGAKNLNFALLERFWIRKSSIKVPELKVFGTEKTTFYSSISAIFSNHQWNFSTAVDPLCENYFRKTIFAKEHLRKLFGVQHQYLSPRQAIDSAREPTKIGEAICKLIGQFCWGWMWDQDLGCFCLHTGIYLSGIIISYNLLLEFRLSRPRNQMVCEQPLSAAWLRESTWTFWIQGWKGRLW